MNFVFETAHMYVLPLTGGNGPMVVTAVGIGLAVLSLLLFVLRGKSDDKKKEKRRSRGHAPN